MTSLRIVLVLIDAPVPFGSAAARWFYVLLRELVARGHRVTALVACSKPSEMDEARRLFPSPQYDLRLYPFPHRQGLLAKFSTLLRPYSFMFSREFKSDLTQQLAAGYDILHLEQLWSGWLAHRHTKRTLISILNLYQIDLSEVNSSGLFARFRKILLFKSEIRLIRYYPRFYTLSERLRNQIKHCQPTANVSVLPLGIDYTLYPYIADSDRRHEQVVGVIGSMGWHPTYTAAVRLVTRLWPEIKRQVPAAKLQLVGWGAKTALRDYLAMEDVRIEENVPATRPYFENMSVMLYAPGRGSGMKVKILEALGYGVPVVTTSEGVEGIPAKDGVHAGVCDDDAGLIQRTVALLSDPGAQNRQRAAGRALLESHCGPKATVDAIEAIYWKMIQR